jgi:hypothetical protein
VWGVPPASTPPYPQQPAPDGSTSALPYVPAPGTPEFTSPFPPAPASAPPPGGGAPPSFGPAAVPTSSGALPAADPFGRHAAPAEDGKWAVPPRVQSAIDAVRASRSGRHGADRAPAEDPDTGAPAPERFGAAAETGTGPDRGDRATGAATEAGHPGAMPSRVRPAAPRPGAATGGAPAQGGADTPTTETPVLATPTRVDAESVLAAVRDVPGVRGADLRTDAAGGRTLRLDVADGVDPDEITAAAGHALRDRLGVEARLTVADADDELDVAQDDRAELDRTAGGAATPALRAPGRGGDPRAVIERIQVATAGSECAVEVCLTADGVRAVGRAGGPALDPYLLRVAAQATADAVGVLVAGRARCAVEHVDVVTAGPCRVVVVVLVLLAGDTAERLVGSAVAGGDPRQATVRATMSALNRRLVPLLDAVLT